MSEKPVVRVDTGAGTFWCMGWLFTIGFAKLGFWQGVIAIILWPYFLALALRP